MDYQRGAVAPRKLSTYTTLPSAPVVVGSEGMVRFIGSFSSLQVSAGGFGAVPVNSGDFYPCPDAAKIELSAPTGETFSGSVTLVYYPPSSVSEIGAEVN